MFKKKVKPEEVQPKGEIVLMKDRWVLYMTLIFSYRNSENLETKKIDTYFSFITYEEAVSFKKELETQGKACTDRISRITYGTPDYTLLSEDYVINYSPLTKENYDTLFNRSSCWNPLALAGGGMQGID